ncbi:MAG: tetratricopeptide repeat protein [Pyrinomonadaceae bacterium]|nr:tetratricopeptide repeat protein [Pyrinomonadaceae bacterium]
MNKNIVFGIVGLVIGLLIGFFAANSINKNSAQVVSQVPAQNAPPPNQQVPNVLVKEQPKPTGGMLPDVSATIDKANNEPTNYDAQIKAGDLYQQIKGLEKAVVFYERAHQIKPDDYELIVKLGNTYFDARQFEAAAKWYEQALAKKPDDTNVRTDLGITYVERAAPDYARAAQEFQTSLKANPKHEPTLYNLGAAYLKQGNSEEANKTLAQLEQANPNSQLVGKLRQLMSQQ